jgi:hypothetical protein
MEGAVFSFEGKDKGGKKEKSPTAAFGKNRMAL